jgi:hypothetical protein
VAKGLGRYQIASNAPVAPPSNAASPGFGGKPVFTPEQTKASDALGDQSKGIIDAAAKAPVALQRLDVIDNATQNFRPGLTGNLRLSALRGLTDALQTAGITPPDWVKNGAAGGETIGKEGGYLATELTRSLGSREALGVFNAIQRIVPNVEMSSGGFKVITDALRQGVLRDQDIAQYRSQWLQNPQHQGSIAGMQEAFDASHPVEQYASKVVPYPYPKTAAEAKPNVIYNTKHGPAMWDGHQFQPVQ